MKERRLQVRRHCCPGRSLYRWMSLCISKAIIESEGELTMVQDLAIQSPVD